MANDKVKPDLIQDSDEDNLTIDWINETETEIEKPKKKKNNKGKKTKQLSLVKHTQPDFFIADIFDAISFQTDMASLEYPLFVLKAGDKTDRHFSGKGYTIDIRSSSFGHATIHDKDIWIYCISKIMQAKKEGEETSRTVHFTIYDYLRTTNRHVSGSDYERAKDSLDRLRNTNITTEIETAEIREARGFGLVDSWRILEEKKGRMIRVSVTLPEWLYRSIEIQSVLTISPDYFRLRSGLDRRIYELARKHCGYNPSWTFNLKILQEKAGSVSSLKDFRRSVKALATSNHLPEYEVIYDGEKDQVIFKRRLKILENTQKNQDNQNPKRKKISEREASQMARTGETWDELLKRIGGKYYVIFDKK